MLKGLVYLPKDRGDVAKTSQPGVSHVTFSSREQPDRIYGSHADERYKGVDLIATDRSHVQHAGRGTKDQSLDLGTLVCRGGLG